MAPSPGALLRRAPHLAWRRVVEETVVLDLARRQVFGLSDEAAALLAALAEPRDLIQLAARLAAADETPRAAIARLTRLLDELRGVGLVEGDPAASSGADAGAASQGILWREQLEEVTQQTSPPMQIGNPQCLQ